MAHKKEPETGIEKAYREAREAKENIDQLLKELGAAFAAAHEALSSAANETFLLEKNLRESNIIPPVPGNKTFIDIRTANWLRELAQLLEDGHIRIVHLVTRTPDFSESVQDTVTITFSVR